MNNKSKPLLIIRSRAPIRICDNGGWTDTWFAEYGRIFNIAVSPHTNVKIEAYPREERTKQVRLRVSNYGDDYAFNPGERPWHKHPLLEAAIAKMGILEEYTCDITVSSEAPAGMSTGTSAAVTVALIGALDLLNGTQMTRHEIAYAAHSIEMEMLGQQSGIQDQLASAYGGVNYIEMEAFPQANVTQIQIADEQLEELERRLVLVYLGKAHSSSKVHEMVIAELEDVGPEDERLVTLRRAAELSRDAVMAGDWFAFGEAMQANVAAQSRLHPELVSTDAKVVIEIAQGFGALGWKVNGAGGEGGSLTILCGGDERKNQEMILAIEKVNDIFQIIPTSIDLEGLKRWSE